jgi:hypothetical protein
MAAVEVLLAIHQTLISVLLVIPNGKHFVTIVGSWTIGKNNGHIHKDMQCES